MILLPTKRRKKKKSRIKSFRKDDDYRQIFFSSSTSTDVGQSSTISHLFAWRRGERRKGCISHIGTCLTFGWWKMHIDVRTCIDCRGEEVSKRSQAKGDVLFSSLNIDRTYYSHSVQTDICIEHASTPYNTTLFSLQKFCRCLHESSSRKTKKCKQIYHEKVA